jgi:hypothetical protein
MPELIIEQRISKELILFAHFPLGEIHVCKREMLKQLHRDLGRRGSPHYWDERFSHRWDERCLILRWQVSVEGDA